jgi:hypothetical protein
MRLADLIVNLETAKNGAEGGESSLRDHPLRATPSRKRLNFSGLTRIQPKSSRANVRVTRVHRSLGALWTAVSAGDERRSAQCRLAIWERALA